jgi:hypothetical protein
MQTKELPSIATYTLESLASEYHIGIKTLKKQILFIKPQLEKLQVIKTRYLTPSQVALIRYKLGEPKNRAYTYTAIAELLQIDFNTLIYSWLKSPHKERLQELQPTKCNKLTPRQVDYIFSLLDIHLENNNDIYCTFLT